MILLVDDKEENLLSLKKLLTHYGFKADTALSGEEALKKVLVNEYALIILDVQMPGMDGFEVAEAISGYNKTRETPILFLSAANTEKKFITQGYLSGAVDYLTKPVDPDILILKVKTYCRLYEQNQELNKIRDSLMEEVSMRKKVEADLRSTAVQLRSILESIPQIAFMSNKEGEVEYTNHHWFEYSSSKEIPPELHPDDNQVLNQKWSMSVRTGAPLELEVRVKKISDHQYRYHLLKIVPVQENNKLVRWVGTFTDIHDQKIAEIKKDDFISIASHELKTPLTSIKAYFQLLERALAETGSEEMKKFASRANAQLDKLNTLVTDLLDVSKIQSGRLVYQKKDFRFNSVFQNVLDNIYQMNPGKKIVVNGDPDVMIHGDAGRIEQVLVNYLTNAIKYSPGAPEIHVKTKVENSQLEVRVKDFGIGIPKEKLPHIFSKFYRVEDSSSRFQGLGIGLYICAEVIKNHNGQYGVESEPEKGSEFYFRLPVVS